MDDRIKVEKQHNKLVLTILALKNKQQQQLLAVWIVLFSLCGIAIFSQFFFDYNSKTKLFFGIYIVFWSFFEFKVVYAYRWRSLGVEQISIDTKELLLTKQIGGRGVTQKYNTADIQEIKLCEKNVKDFFSSMTSSYWSINNYKLSFIIDNQSVLFGIDISDKEAKKLQKMLYSYIKL